MNNLRIEIGGNLFWAIILAVALTTCTLTAPVVPQ
jgi:hypothetical protein